MAKAMYFLPKSWVPWGVRTMWSRFVCWRLGHTWKLNRNDPMCSRCGKYKRTNAGAVARRKKRRWK